MTTTTDAFAAALDGLDPIGLDALGNLAELQNRHDAKFLVPMRALPTLVREVAGRMNVLAVDGDRSVAYHSIYFDTPDRALYRAHVQRRRLRYKVRTRHYGTSAETMLELKLKVVRGRTEKHRWALPDGAPDRLGPGARLLLDEVLASAYGWSLPADLEPSLHTTFRRSTLVDPLAGERLTVDVDFGVADGRRTVAFDPEVAVVECKTSALYGPILRTMVTLGHRPERVSKYCVGVVVTDPPLAGNDWYAALRVLQSPATGTPAPSNSTTC